MRWTIRVKDDDATPGIEWAKDYLSQFDTAKLKYININPGSKHAYGVYGACHFPTKSDPQYKISCHLPGPFPCEILVRKSPLYQRPDGSFPKAPKGCRRTVLCEAPGTPGKNRGQKKRWYRVVGHTHIDTIDEAVVWIFAHEIFHYLRRTKQIPGRNNEIEADRFADEQLDQYRLQRGTRPAEKPRQMRLFGLFSW